MTNVSLKCLPLLRRILMLSASVFTSVENTIKLPIARHDKKNTSESRLLLKRIFIALVLNILSDAQTQNNASMRCFVFSRLHLCSCQGSARRHIKSSHNKIAASQLDLSPASYQPNHTSLCLSGMTGSWVHPADIIQITPLRSSHFPFNGKWRLSSVSGG